MSVLGLVGVTGVVFLAIRAASPEPPKTRTKEWEQASNERALQQKMNPITGRSSQLVFIPLLIPVQVFLPKATKAKASSYTTSRLPRLIKSFHRQDVRALF